MLMSPEGVKLDVSHVLDTFLDSFPPVRSLRLHQPQLAHWRLGVRDTIEAGEDPASSTVAEFSLDLPWRHSALPDNTQSPVTYHWLSSQLVLGRLGPFSEREPFS